MAHIADCMMASTEYGLNNFIAKELTPQSSVESLQLHGQPHGQHVEEKEKYVWRMHQPAEPRKYQLFPLKEKLSIASLRSASDLEKLAAVQSRRSKSKETPSLLRRRKPSVSDLGPMTTVQEVAMDSPTIPGRPPLHERSISAPGHGWRSNVFGDTMISMISRPTIEEQLESIPATPWPPASNEDISRSTTPRIPNSPKLLRKLVIPDTTILVPEHLISKSLSQEDDQRPEVPPKSARMTPKPQTSTPTPSTTSNIGYFSHEIPSTAPAGRLETKPWDLPLSAAPTSAPPGLPAGHFRNQSEQPVSRVNQTVSHRREQSEASIMDRGRPKKRSASARKPVKPVTTEAPPARRELTEDEIAFATLPTGFKAIDADSYLDDQELEALRRQAIGQAAKFEVLTVRDVDDLSRELRGLDERCEYLRKTHRSLRSGRRNLHERICSYLRSPRVARFSHSAILKQEEALIELDASIDDWVYKLEQAENRRTRVRQKLLEHVAAALTLNSPCTRTPARNMNRNRFIDDRFDETHYMNTPPRSPTKLGSTSPSSPPRSPSSTYTPSPSNQYEHYQTYPTHTSTSSSQSPQRLAEQVRISSPSPDLRMSLQSIRIYADSDVYALLADVEEEINRMGELGYEESPVETPVRGGSPFGLLSSATYDSRQASF